jgi:hypothetical protein
LLSIKKTTMDRNLYPYLYPRVEFHIRRVSGKYRVTVMTIKK